MQTANERATAVSDKQAATVPRILVLIAVAAVVVLVVALGVQLLRLRDLESRLDETTAALAASRLQVEIGAAVIAVQQGNYELARQRASNFFSGLQRAASMKGTNVPPGVSGLLARRDSAITSLSRNSPESTALLRALDTEYAALELSRTDSLPRDAR